MTKNVTLRIDQTILHKARHEAVEEKKSLSLWLTELITKRVEGKGNFEKARDRAIKRMKKGFALGGKPFKREDVYDRPILR